jgi:hypothetical protein
MPFWFNETERYGILISKSLEKAQLDDFSCGLLRPRRDRPSRRHAKCHDEVAPLHVHPSLGQGTARIKLARWMGLGVTSGTARLDRSPMSVLGQKRTS